MRMLLYCWNTLCELAPWLLLGMLISGAMHVLLPEGFVRRKFQGFGGIIKSVALGVPLPLCSCGVIPAGIGLKNQGASDGASVGFLISTPQTGVDSVLVSAGFLGWPFAIFKVVAAAIIGIAGGWLADSKPKDDPLAVIQVDGHGGHHHESKYHHPLARMLDHSVDVFQSIWGWLIVGVLISAIIDQFMPAEWLQTVGKWGLLPAMLLMLLISAPLYVCATASVPIAAALVRGGLPPAAALVFLMAGPATNVTTIGAIYQHFGRRPTLAYLGSILVGSMTGAWIFHHIFATDQLSSGLAVHDHVHNAWWSVASAILLLILVAYFLVSDLRRRL